MPRYVVELLRPMVSVTLVAKSEEEAHWLAIESFVDDVKNAPMRVTEKEETGE